MKREFKLEHEKERGVVRVFGEGWGVVYIIVKNQIKLKEAFLYETNEKGRCIGFEVKEEIDLEPFHICIKEFAKENNVEIIE